MLDNLNKKLKTIKINLSEIIEAEKNKILNTLYDGNIKIEYNEIDESPIIKIKSNNKNYMIICDEINTNYHKIEIILFGDEDGNLIIINNQRYFCIVSREDKGDGHSIALGNGKINNERSGDGNGHVLRLGNGDGSANRYGRGNGHAIKNGSGNGYANRTGNGHGNVLRLGSGNGYASHSGDGNGNALRLGSGNGNADRSDNGHSHGHAIRLGSGIGNASRFDHANNNMIRLNNKFHGVKSLNKSSGYAIHSELSNGYALRYIENEYALRNCDI